LAQLDALPLDAFSGGALLVQADTTPMATMTASLAMESPPGGGQQVLPWEILILNRF
jgi:hypothetical protein